MKRTTLAAVGVLLLAGCSASGPSGGAPDPKNCVASGTEDSPPPIGHVFVIMLAAEVLDGRSDQRGCGTPITAGRIAVCGRRTSMATFTFATTSSLRKYPKKLSPAGTFSKYGERPTTRRDANSTK